MTVSEIIKPVTFPNSNMTISAYLDKDRGRPNNLSCEPLNHKRSTKQPQINRPPRSQPHEPQLRFTAISIQDEDTSWCTGIKWHQASCVSS